MIQKVFIVLTDEADPLEQGCDRCYDAFVCVGEDELLSFLEAITEKDEELQVYELGKEVVITKKVKYEISKTP